MPPKVLDQVIIVSGSVRAAARFCGLNQNSVYAWLHRGEVSAVGALLIEHSEVLGKLFTADELRPDVTDARWRSVYNDNRFKTARRKQKRFEETKIFAELSSKSPIHIVLDRSLSDV